MVAAAARHVLRPAEHLGGDARVGLRERPLHLPVVRGRGWVEGAVVVCDGGTP
jgi:hypothetical protein